MKASTIGLAACAVLLTACVVREVHEIRYVRDDGKRAPGDRSATCDGCDSGAAPGAVMADSQPPPPLVEEPLDQPSDGYVWTDGYWDWTGTDWDWVSGTWVPPVDEGVVYIPPAYYATGSHCLYVPGRWAPGQRVAGVRDHRSRGGRGDGRGDGKVRDHRSDGGGYGGRDGDGKSPPSRGVRDHRGEKPPSDPDVDLVTGGRGSDVVIRVPPRVRHRPSRSRPDMTPGGAGPVRSGEDVVPASGVNGGMHVIDGDGRGRARDSGPDRVIAPDSVEPGGAGANGASGASGAPSMRDYRDYVIVRPRQPGRAGYPGRFDGRDVGRAPSPTAIPPSRDMGAGRSQGYWVLPVPPSRATAPGMGGSPRGPGPVRVGPPVQSMPPSAGPSSAPPAAGQSGQPSAPAAQPAGNRSYAHPGHAAPAHGGGGGRAAGASGRGR